MGGIENWVEEGKEEGKGRANNGIHMVGRNFHRCPRRSIHARSFRTFRSIKEIGIGNRFPRFRIRNDTTAENLIKEPFDLVWNIRRSLHARQEKFQFGGGWEKEGKNGFERKNPRRGDEWSLVNEPIIRMDRVDRSITDVLPLLSPFFSSIYLK